MRFIYWIGLGLVAAAMFNAILVSGPARTPILPVHPVVVFWPPNGDPVTHGTYISTNYPNIGHYKAVILGFANGHMRQLSDDQIISNWEESARKWGNAIGIDEFIPGSDEHDKRLSGLIDRFRAANPKAVVAVWHSGFLNETTARSYRKSADLVMLETYGPFNLRQIYRMIVNAILARWYHIDDRCVFGFGMDDEASPERLAKWGLWANSPIDLRRLIRFGKFLLPRSPGVAFFALSSSQHLIEAAEQTSYETYGR